MSIVTRTNKQIRKGRGRCDPEKIESFTEADLARFAREDDSETEHLGEPRYIPAPLNVRALRNRLGLSQSAFARRYSLSVRTVQQWEQGQREPSDAARVLLYAIARDPTGMATQRHQT